MKKTITIGPFRLHFVNHNKAMGLPGHMHYSEAFITLQTTGDIGYPAFEETNDVVYNFLVQATDLAFRNATNEDVEQRLFDALDTFLDSTSEELHPTLKAWGGDYRLHTLALRIMGVRDKIGHSPGFTTYTVSRD